MTTKRNIFTRVEAARFLGTTYSGLKKLVDDGYLREQGGWRERKMLLRRDLEAYKARSLKNPDPRRTLSASTCAGRLETCRQHAVTKGGALLSTEYHDSYSPLRWQCAAGHQWFASYANVKPGRKHGSWCAQCFFNNRIPPWTAAKLRAMRDP